MELVLPLLGVGFGTTAGEDQSAGAATFVAAEHNGAASGDTHFRIANLAEAQKFQDQLAIYVNRRAPPAIFPFTLVSAYKRFERDRESGRLFVSLFDILISHVHLKADSHSALAIWGEKFTKGKLEGGSILDCTDRFGGKFEMHRFATSYILRLRAMWDKIMGYLVLRYSPGDYQHFSSTRSRKRAFEQIAARTPAIPSEVATTIRQVITKLDDDFRTAESHGTGVLRKSLFSMEPIESAANPIETLAAHWNELTLALNLVAQDVEMGIS